MHAAKKTPLVDITNITVEANAAEAFRRFHFNVPQDWSPTNFDDDIPETQPKFRPTSKTSYEQAFERLQHDALKAAWVLRGELETLRLDVARSKAATVCFNKRISGEDTTEAEKQLSELCASGDFKVDLGDIYHPMTLGGIQGRPQLDRDMISGLIAKLNDLVELYKD